jgi:hypothetical protein
MTKADLHRIDRRLAGGAAYPKSRDIRQVFDPEASRNLASAIARALIALDDAGVERVIRALVDARPSLASRLVEWTAQGRPASGDESLAPGWDDLPDLLASPPL